MTPMQTPQERLDRTIQLTCSNFSFNRRKSSLFVFALEDLSLILLGKENTHLHSLPCVLGVEKNGLQCGRLCCLPSVS